MNSRTNILQEINERKKKEMFGKPKTAEEIIKMINALPEDEQDKLFDALVREDEEEKEEEVREEETPAEEAEEKTEEKTEEAAEEEAVETPVETPEEAEEEKEEETEEQPAEEEEHAEDVKDAVDARISALEQMVDTLTERLNKVVENSEGKGFGTPSDAPVDGEDKDEMSEAERNYFAKSIRR